MSNRLLLQLGMSLGFAGAWSIMAAYVAYQQQPLSRYVWLLTVPVLQVDIAYFTAIDTVNLGGADIYLLDWFGVPRLRPLQAGQDQRLGGVHDGGAVTLPRGRRHGLRSLLRLARRRQDRALSLLFKVPRGGGGGGSDADSDRWDCHW